MTWLENKPNRLFDGLLAILSMKSGGFFLLSFYVVDSLVYSQVPCFSRLSLV